MAKNLLALVGLFTVVNASIDFYRHYVKRPLERAATEAFDDEARRAHAADGAAPSDAAA